MASTTFVKAIYLADLNFQEIPEPIKSQLNQKCCICLQDKAFILIGHAPSNPNDTWKCVQHFACLTIQIHKQDQFCKGCGDNVYREGPVASLVPLDLFQNKRP